MPEKKKLPAALRDKLIKAGKARAAQITHEERSKWAKQAWEKRVQKAEEAESKEHIRGTAIVTPPGNVTMPVPETEKTWPPQDEE